MKPTHEVRLFYAESAPPPFEPGAMALHTWNVGLHSRDMEIAAGRRRPEIGRIEWREAGDTVWHETAPKDE